MQKKHIIFLFFTIMIFASCGNSTKFEKGIAFYHWKSKAKFPDAYKDALKLTNSEKIYLHYFDVKAHNSEYYTNFYPVYVIKEIADEYKNYKIVPVIYITNSVIGNKELDISDLSKKITKLTNQISLTHFDKKITEIQLDCDWTQSTKNVYFELIEKLSFTFDIDVTIRLHQIKFKEKTGIPPVKHGTLMLYNVGDLKNKKQNSILESSVVEQYINSETDYPLQLNVALPLFSQTVIFNNNNKIRLIKDVENNDFINDKHFKKVNETIYNVEIDTLYKGFYLMKNFKLKLEKLDENEVAKSYKIIKNSKLNTKEVIFYHLDENSLKNIDINKIISQL